MLMRQADICLHEYMSVVVQMKTLTFLDTLRVLINAKRLAMIVISQFLDSASKYHQFEIKEALHSLWERPVLNKQAQHLTV